VKSPSSNSAHSPNPPTIHTLPVARVPLPVPGRAKAVYASGSQPGSLRLGQSACGSNSDYSWLPFFQLLRPSSQQGPRLKLRAALYTSECVSSLYFAPSNCYCTSQSILRLGRQSAIGSNSEYFQLLRPSSQQGLRLNLRAALYTSECVGSLYFTHSNCYCTSQSILCLGQSASGSSCGYSCNSQLVCPSSQQGPRLNLIAALFTSECVGSLYFAHSNCYCTSQSILCLGSSCGYSCNSQLVCPGSQKGRRLNLRATLHTSECVE
jgi:hypothetical protein